MGIASCISYWRYIIKYQAARRDVLSDELSHTIIHLVCVYKRCRSSFELFAACVHKQRLEEHKGNFNNN